MTTCLRESSVLGNGRWCLVICSERRKVGVFMNMITQITEHPRKAGQYVIDVDGKQFAVVTADALAATKARIGVVVDDRLAARLNEANELTAAYDRALNLLAFRARSARELQRRLVQKGVTAERADRVIAKLRE